MINKADKGSTIVVEDREDYVRNALSHLGDTSVYKPLAEVISHTLQLDILQKLKLIKHMVSLNKLGMISVNPQTVFAHPDYISRKNTQNSYEH